MRTALIGDTIFTKRCFEALISNGFKVVTVLQSHSKQSDQIADYYSLVSACKAANIEHRHFYQINSTEVADYLRSLNLDVVLSFGHLGYFKEPLLKIPKLGCIGSYAGPLPEYPGLSPLSWAILKDLNKTALTFYKMTPNSYTGNIILKSSCDVIPGEYVTSLYTKICDLAEDMIPQLKLQLYLGLPQQKIQKPEEIKEYWRWLSKVDSILDFNQPCDSLVKIIRAFSHPLHGAWFNYEDQQVIAWKGLEGKFKTNLTPGSLVYEDDNYFVMTTETKDLVLTSFEKTTQNSASPSTAPTST